MIVADLRHSWSLQRRVHQGRGRRGHDCSCGGVDVVGASASASRTAAALQGRAAAGHPTVLVVGARAGEALPCPAGPNCLRHAVHIQSVPLACLADQYR
jgi:hypothetical protein